MEPVFYSSRMFFTESNTIVGSIGASGGQLVISNLNTDNLSLTGSTGPTGMQGPTGVSPEYAGLTGTEVLFMGPTGVTGASDFTFQNGHLYVANSLNTQFQQFIQSQSHPATGATGTVWYNSTQHLLYADDQPIPTHVPPATQEPTGHAVRTDSQIAFNTNTRTFTISPVGFTYDVWVAGTRFRKNEPLSVTIPNTSGLYYIYFGVDGTLGQQATFFVWDQQAPTAYIYYNADHPSESMMFDERHGITMDWATHEYLHRTRGAQIANGFSIADYTTTGTGTLDSDAQFSVEAGTFFDEDLEVAITNSTNPVGIWEQYLQAPCRLPVLYKNGTAWRKTIATNFAFSVGPNSLPHYNSESGGTWTLAESANNQFIIQWIAATNMARTPVVSIMGQQNHGSLKTAQNDLWENLNLTDFPIVEFRPVAKIVFEVRTSYTNNVNCRIVYVEDLRSISVITGVPNTLGATGMTGPTGPAASLAPFLGVYSDQNDSMLGSNTPQVCKYNVIADDPDTIHTWYNSTLYRFTPQKSGWWNVNANYDVYRGSNEEASLILRKNEEAVGAQSGVGAIQIGVSKTIYLNGSTDYIDVVNAGADPQTRQQSSYTSYLQLQWLRV